MHNIELYAKMEVFEFNQENGESLTILHGDMVMLCILLEPMVLLLTL